MKSSVVSVNKINETKEQKEHPASQGQNLRPRIKPSITEQ